MAQTRKRRAAKERWINELTEEDVQKRIRVLGAIVSINTIQNQEQKQMHTILDDGTGQIQVIINDPTPLNLGKQVRIFGILGKNEKNDYILTAEIIQDMSALDMDLYQRVQAVKKRFKAKYQQT
ncbi:MAG: hypothetical protein ACTSQI_01290 [Candidatus Helarchaeota archaeon]